MSKCRVTHHHQITEFW